jgi:hypothetical protein
MTTDLPEDVREMIRVENELINQRLSWLASLQGLLFAALGFAWGKTNTYVLILLFAGMGALVAISIGLATYRANKAIARLSTWWDDNVPAGYSGVGVEGVKSQSGLSWLMPGYFLPWVFAAAWLAVGISHLFSRG